MKCKAPILFDYHLWAYVTRKRFSHWSRTVPSHNDEFITRATKGWATITGFGTRTTKRLSAMLFTQRNNYRYHSN